MDAKSSHEALEAVLRSVQGEPLVILISGHPDPDAIGSAIAHQRICESLGVPATIAHVLPLSHRENRALVKLLHVDMQQVTSRDDCLAMAEAAQAVGRRDANQAIANVLEQLAAKSR